MIPGLWLGALLRALLDCSGAVAGCGSFGAMSGCVAWIVLAVPIVVSNAILS